MIATLAVTALLVVTTGGTDCKTVVDRTDTCTSPAQVTSTIAADAKPEPPKAVVDPAMLSGEFAFMSVGLALAGGAALGVAYAVTPSSDDERRVQTIEQVGGASLLVTAGLVGASAAALSVFDPSTGEFRLKKLFAGSD